MMGKMYHAQENAESAGRMRRAVSNERELGRAVRQQLQRASALLSIKLYNKIADIKGMRKVVIG